MSKSITPRPNYLSTPGADRAAYLQTQRDLFGACRDNGLPVEGPARDKMILAVARYLGDKNITSRKQLTPVENRLIAEAVNRNFFNTQWLLNPYTQTAAMLRSIWNATNAVPMPLLCAQPLPFATLTSTSIRLWTENKCRAAST